MPYEFTVIGSRIRLPKQKQDATLLRLNEALSRSTLMQGKADLFLYEYRKHKGNASLSFIAMLELWGWYPTFDQTTGDLVALTSHRSETEDERLEQQFFDLLAPDLDDGNYVEVDIDHQRRRYVSFQGKMYQLDASYSYPPLHKVIVHVKDLRSSHQEPFPDEQIILTLSNNYTLRSGGDEYELGAYARICDEQGLERVYWSAEEWRDAPEEVVGAIFGALLHPERFANLASNQFLDANVRWRGEELSATFLAWNGEKLSYSQSFDARDRDGEEQTDSEGLIAAHLSDEYEKFDLYGHTRWIIAFVVESFFQDVLNRPVEDMLQLMEDLPKYLAAWQNQLAKPNDGPNDGEAAQAGRDVLLLTLRFLCPEWVKVNHPISEDRGLPTSSPESKDWASGDID